MSVPDRLPDPNFSSVWRDPLLLGAAPEFKDRETWRNWEVVGKVLFGEPLTSEELSVYQKFTQRPAPPEEPDELLVVAGRRAGKSKFASVVGTYLATVPSWREYLSAGEVGVVALFAPNQRSAIAVLLRYIRALVRGSSALRKELTRETADTLEFGRLRTSISVWPSTYRANRGGTLIAAVVDEIDFLWQHDSPNAASEVVAAVRPGLVSLPGSKLLMIGTPYSVTGFAHAYFQRHWGRPGRQVCWRAASLEMNTTLEAGRIEEQRDEDPIAALSEWDALWRPGASALFEPHMVAACTRPLATLAPQRNVAYFGAVDVSGGTGSDAFAWAISHKEVDREQNVTVVVDLARARTRRGREPLDLDATVAECVTDLRAYGVWSVVGDRYGGDWPAQMFARYDMRYEKSGATKSDAYLNLVPLVSTRRIEFPDDPLLRDQLILLERRRGSQGRDSVDHPPGGHDDVANATALAAMLALTWQPRFIPVGF